MKKLHLILLFCWISIQLNAQTTFRASYDIASFDISGGMVQNPAGDFVMAGTNASFLPLYGNAMKLNASGNVVWAKSFVGGLATDFWDIKNVSTGGFIMCGSSSGSGAILVRIDDNGNLIWSMRYTLPDRPADDASNEYAQAVMETSDGGFIVGGGVDYFWDGVSGNTVDTSSCMGFKVNSTGVLQWCRVWTIATTNPDEHYINDVGESSDGYFFVGESSEGSGTPNSDGDYPRNAVIIKTTTAGALTYARRWGNGNTNSEGLNSIMQIPSGEMLIGGYDNADATLFKINGAGATATLATTFNIKLRGGAFDTYIIQDIMRNSDGNFSIIGMHIQPLSFAFNTSVFKFNSTTELQMIGKDYASIGLSAILPEGGLASDDGFFMSMTDQQAGGFNYNIIRTDAAGNLNDVDPGCTPTNVNPVITSYDPVFNVLSPTVFTLGSGASFTPVVSNIVPTKGENCLNVVCTAPAAPTASASPATICNGQSSTITSTAPAGVTFYYYTVSTGGTAFASGGSTVVSPTTTTIYYVESDDNSNPGCKSARTPVTITVNQPPNAGTAGSVSFCSNSASGNLFASLGGSPAATGTWSGPSALAGGNLGTYNPATCAPGVYTYTVTGTAPCTNATATVTVTENAAPNAGTAGTITLCSTSASSNLFSSLGGSPAATGTWSGPSALAGGNLGTYNPATCAPGVYTYTVTGTAPCANATATVTVTENTAPVAGTAGTITLCSNSASANLFASLGGTPDATGTWSGPSVLAGGNLGTYNPATCAPGIYTYTVTGTAPCANATATVTVTENAAPNAGTAGTITLCSTSASSNLFSSLGGSPAATGTWSGPSALAGGNLGTYNPATCAPGVYTYTVTGTAPCANATATVTVTENTAPVAGTNGTITLCSSSASANLFASLGGTPNATGTWSGPSVLAGGNLGTYNPATCAPGIYTYTVTGTAPCANATATVTVTENTAPSAGTNGTITLCSNGAAVNLLASLGGTPAGGGTWTGPSALTGGANGTFTPGTNTAGVYTYTVTGTAPCANATATVTVSITTAPNSGTNTTTTVCSNGSAVNLFSLLGGTPQAGGAWTGPSVLTGGSLGTFTPGTNTAGVYSYTVTGIAPCSGTSVSTVTVSVTSAPNSGTSATTTVCSNGSAVNLFTILTGSPQTGGTWTGPSTLTGGSNGTFTPGTNTSGVYTYTVNGVAPCAGSVNSTVTVNVNTPPVAGTNGTLSICSNGIATNLFSSLGGSPAAGGTWSGPTVLTGGANGTFTPGTNTAGTYTYTVVGTAPCANATATVVVTVNNAPATATVNATSTTICAGQSTTISASGTGGVTFNVYDAASSGNLLGVTPLSVSPSGTTTYFVEAVSANGCVNSGALAQITITVISIDDPSWTSPGATCVQAGNINLDALITGTTGGTWSGTGVTGSLFDPTGLAGQTINITYSVGTSPCVQTLTQSISVQATISGAWTTPGTICESDGIVNLNSTITGTAGGSWSGTGVVGNTFDPTGLSGTVSITYTVGVNPCLDAVTHDIIVNSSPLDPTVTATDDTLCAGESVTITGSGSGGGTTYNIYDAATGGTLVGVSPLTFTPTGSDSYFIEATNSNGCVNLGGRVEIIIVVNPVPTADAGSDIQICPNDNTNLTATGGGNYLWSTTETTASINVAPTSNTTYYVTVTNSDNCSAMDSVTVTIYTLAGTLDAVLDSTVTEESETVTTDVALNDAGNINAVVILSNPSNGTATVNGTSISYTPNADFIGVDTLIYIVCDAFCTSYCDTALLIIRVEEDVNIFVPNGFSPNGDGVNDELVILGLDDYPENELFIYNRWGELVYHSKPYNNDWIGQSNNDKLKLTGDEVIDGTYFYVLKLSPEVEDLNGYIELRRR